MAHVIVSYIDGCINFEADEFIILFLFFVCYYICRKPGWPNNTKALARSHRAFAPFLARAPTRGMCRVVRTDIRVQTSDSASAWCGFALHSPPSPIDLLRRSACSLLAQTHSWSGAKRRVVCAHIYITCVSMYVHQQ